MVINYEEYLKGTQPDIKDYSQDALYQRGKFLVEYVDKKKTLLTGEILSKTILKYRDNNDKSRMVISSAPGSGKTTAMRQFIVKYNNSVSGVVAMNRMDDVERFYYDTMSNLMYELKNNKMKNWKANTSNNSYFKDFFDRDTNVLYDSKHPKSIIELKSSNWIFCTHQRLLTDPESLLYTKNKGTELINLDVPRDTLFIDELPSVMFNKIPYEAVSKAIAANSLVANALGIIPKDVTNTQRIAAVYDNIDRGNLNSQLIDLIDGLPRKGPSLKNLRYLKSSSDKIKSVAKVIEIFNYVLKYQDKFLSIPQTIPDKYGKPDPNPPKWNYSSFDAYYSVINFSVKNILIFDGTADIVLKNSGWKLLKTDNNRKININKIQKVKTGVRRTDSSLDDIINAFSDIIEKIDRSYDHKRKLLVYTWKTKKPKSNFEADDEKELRDKLLEKLKKDGLSNVDIITYKSGKEKSTNEYSDSSVVIILGDFFIPNAAIADFNIANDTNKNNFITSSDYTLSLIIQLLYRTRARKSDSSIDLYIDDNYSEKFIRRVLDSINQNKLEVPKEPLRSNISYKEVDIKTKNTLERIGMDISKEYQDYTLQELKNVIGSPRTHKSAHTLIEQIFKDTRVEVKILKAGGGKSSEAKLRVINPLV